MQREICLEYGNQYKIFLILKKAFQEGTDDEDAEETLFLKVTEAIFVCWFTLEYLIRFIVSAHKV